MTQIKFAILFLVALAAPLFPGNANAVVVNYSITFNDPDGAGALTGGSGVLTLDVPALPGPFLFNNGDSHFLGFTATINGENFVASSLVGNINVGTGGQVYNLGVKTPTGAPGSHYFEMFGSAGSGGYNIYTVGNANLISNAGWSVGAAVPQVAAVPETSTWAMMILGFAVVGFTAYRRRNSKLSLRIA